jgi:hypothetical protein
LVVTRRLLPVIPEGFVHIAGEWRNADLIT